MARLETPEKIDIDCRKSEWHPSPLMGQIVLVSSISNQGEFHAARKNWVTMVCQDPPMLGLCCRLSHRTAINILETREFVVNIPGADLAPRLWKAGDAVSDMASREQEAPCWTFTASTKVRAPRVIQARAHLECRLESNKRLHDEEMIFFARIVAASVDKSLIQGRLEHRYKRLQPLFYLEDGLFGLMDEVRKISR